MWERPSHVPLGVWSPQAVRGLRRECGAMPATERHPPPHPRSSPGASLCSRASTDHLSCARAAAGAEPGRLQICQAAQRGGTEGRGLTVVHTRRTGPSAAGCALPSRREGAQAQPRDAHASLAACPCPEPRVSCCGRDPSPPQRHIAEASSTASARAAPSCTRSTALGPS